MEIIHARNLTKTFRRFEKEPGLAGSFKSLFKRRFVYKTAVDGFDLSVEAGEIVGLIGPNGAGKTTLVKMLAGIIAPTSGEISVLGHYPNKLENAFKKQYAVVMGQKSQLIFDLTAADTFLLFKQMYGIPDDVYRRNLALFADLFDARGYLDMQVRTLSLGERMKMELVTALLHDPKVLFLDEPTIGLDAPAQRQIRAFLKEVNRRNGTTVLLTSHYMEDVRSLCPRSVVVGEGRKLYDGGTDELFRAYQTRKKVTVQFDGAAGDGGQGGGVGGAGGQGGGTGAGGQGGAHASGGGAFVLPDGVAAFALPDGCEAVEQGPHKAVFTVPKEMGGAVLAQMVREHPHSDITVEEEDIGLVVERIYRSGRATA